MINYVFYNPNHYIGTVCYRDPVLNQGRIDIRVIAKWSFGGASRAAYNMQLGVL